MYELMYGLRNNEYDDDDDQVFVSVSGPEIKQDLKNFFRGLFLWLI